MESTQERDRRRRLVLMATILGVLLSGALVLTTSRAAFVAQTDNSANSFGAGDVELVDDDSGAAMFNVPNMAPNDPAVEACIEVSYVGSVTDPGEVRLYSGGFNETGTLASELDMAVEIGTGGDFSGCAGFTPTSTIFTTDTLASFDTSHVDYGNALVAWDPASTPESRTFRFTVDLPADADSGVQGDEVTDLEFVWEIQS